MAFAQSPNAVASPATSTVYQLPPVDSNVRQVVVTAMAADPKGEFLAVAGDDHIIRILKADEMRIVHTLGDGGTKKDGKPGHFDWIRTLAFDSDGSRLVSAGNDGQLILWKRNRDFAIMQEIDSAPALACVSFSPSGKQMAAVGFDSRVFLIGSTPNQMPGLSCDCIDLRCCCYRGDGAALAVAGRDGYLHLFDPVTGKLNHEESIHDGRIRDMKFMPASNILVSVSEDGEVVRYDTERRQVLSRRTITSGRLFAVAIIDSNTIAAAGSDDEIYLVSTDQVDLDLAVIGTLRGHVGSVATLVMSNGVLISGGFDSTIRRWQIPLLTEPQDKIALKNGSGVQAESER